MINYLKKLFSAGGHDGADEAKRQEERDFDLLKYDGIRAMRMGKTDYAIELRDRYNAVEPAWHFNKRYWNQVLFDRDANSQLIRHLIDHSYEEVLKKFTRKMRNEYDALP